MFGFFHFSFSVNLPILIDKISSTQSIGLTMFFSQIGQRVLQDNSKQVCQLINGVRATLQGSDIQLLENLSRMGS
jgi:hypothetical protein